jgi:hypothetical protein
MKGIEFLLEELCDQGFCLPPETQAQLIRHPPEDIDEFTDAVIKAEGLDPLDIPKGMRRGVREVVAKYFAKYGAEAMEWFSALLVFRLELAKDEGWIFFKKLESIIVFKAGDFADAHRTALEIGEKRAVNESIRDDTGVRLKLTFCYVSNLDIVGPEIEGREVWSRLSDDSSDSSPDLGRSPTQTI